MSSTYVRDTLKTFIAAEAPTESVIDLTSSFQEIQELIADNDVQPDAPWLGIEFQGDDEVPVGLAANNTQGKYRELGAVYFHVVEVARLGNGDRLLTRGENLRNLLRGRRIGNILIESVTPMNFQQGATLQFEGGYMSASFIIGYEYEFDL